MFGDSGYIENFRLKELKEGIQEDERMLKVLLKSLES
jgi:hypothetical protein